MYPPLSNVLVCCCNVGEGFPSKVRESMFCVNRLCEGTELDRQREPLELLAGKVEGEEKEVRGGGGGGEGEE
jgi:hypothetical protein